MAGLAPPKSREEWDALLKQTAEERAKNQPAIDAFHQLARENERLSVPPAMRIPVAGISSFVVGMTLGMAHGSKTAALRFRAEHSHKLPTTTTGWWMYHKSKNYVMGAGGVKEGIKMGFRVSIWTTSMLAVEHMYDQRRHSKDCINTVMASLTVAGAFSLWNRFSLPMTARTTKTALAIGLVYGGVQDALGALRGRHIGYIDWVGRKFGGRGQKQEQKTP